MSRTGHYAIFLVILAFWVSFSATAQQPTWSRFAPAEAADGMDSAATNLEQAIIAFQAAVDRVAARITLDTGPGIEDTELIFQDGGDLDDESPDSTTDREAEEPEATPPSENASPGDSAAPAENATRAGNAAPAENAAPGDSAARAENAPRAGNTASDPARGDTDGLDTLDSAWTAVVEGYRELGTLLLQHPPGGGTVAFADVERYLLSVQGRLGDDLSDVSVLRRRIDTALSSLRDRDGIISYLSEITERDIGEEDSTDTHLRFLLQESSSQWWLGILLKLNPGDRISDLRRQRDAVAEIDPTLAADVATVVDRYRTWSSYYGEIANLDEGAVGGFTIASLLGVAEQADDEVPSLLVRGLAGLGLSGTQIPFERNPVYRTAVTQLAESVSLLSDGQRLGASETLGVDWSTLRVAYATASGLVHHRVGGRRREQIEDDLSLARDAFSVTELSRRADDAHRGYRADGEAAVGRLESYLAPDSSATDEQLQWSTLAVIENRHAQTLVAEGSYPRVRDHLDSFTRRIYESVDRQVVQSIERDYSTVISGGTSDSEAPDHLRQLEMLLPASAREAAPLFRVRALSTPSPEWPLLYDRSVAVEATVESDRGSLSAWVPPDVVAYYYSRAFLEATRGDAGAASPLRWMHMHGQSALPMLDLEGDPFDSQWLNGFEKLLLKAVRPWLDQREQAVDFVQQLDFTARAYARVYALVEIIVTPALSRTRPAIRLDMANRRILAILGDTASATQATQLGQAEIAALVDISPPGRPGFRGNVLVGAVVASLSEDLSTRARERLAEFRLARAADLSRALISPAPDDLSVAGVSFLERVALYGRRGWITDTQASVLRERFYRSITQRGDQWVQE